jgi:hypothetical protein
LPVLVNAKPRQIVDHRVTMMVLLAVVEETRMAVHAVHGNGESTPEGTEKPAGSA